MLGLLDVNDFYGKLSHFLDHLVDEGFVRPPHRAMLQRSDSPDDLLQRLEAWQPSVRPKWSESAPR